MAVKKNTNQSIKPASIKHLANVGDIIAALAACKTFYEITKRKIIFLQCVNVPGNYYPGAVHPTTDENGVQVTLNEEMFKMVQPLVESQDYIERFEKYVGQPVTVDLDVIRGKTDVNAPHGMLAAWPFYAYPDLARDLSKPWITLPEKKMPVEKFVKGKIIVNFTERYRNNVISYHFLKSYAPDLIFSGTHREHLLFCNTWGINIPKLEIKNFLELSCALRSCRFLLGNQSWQWNLCEAAKFPRLLEVFKYADNCQPFMGENSYGYFYQEAAEYYFRLMYNNLK